MWVITNGRKLLRISIEWKGIQVTVVGGGVLKRCLKIVISIVYVCQLDLLSVFMFITNTSTTQQ